MTTHFTCKNRAFQQVFFARILIMYMSELFRRDVILGGGDVTYFAWLVSSALCFKGFDVI